MIWIMLATLAVVFVVGFRVLTSGARKAIRRLSDRLNIDVVPVESMVDQMGKSAGDEFLRICIVRMSRTCKTPRRCCSSGKLSLSMVANRTCCNGIGFYKKPALPRRLPMLRSDWRWVFCAKPNLKCRISMLFRCAITRSFSLPRAFTGCIKTASSYQPTDRA